MDIYFSVYAMFLVLTVGDLFISRRSKRVTLIPMLFLGLVMIAFAGLRWKTGTDWSNYFNYFEYIEEIPIWKSHMEIGYEFIVRTFKLLFSDSYTPFLIFCASFIIFFTYTSVYKHSPYPIFSIFLLLSYSLVGSGFGVRQDLAIALGLISFTFIEERSLIKFAAIVSIASLIHNSAFIFFPAYWIFNMKWTIPKALVTVIIVVICVTLSEKLMLTFGSMISTRKAELYVEMGMENKLHPNPIADMAKGLLGRLLFLLIAGPFVNYKEDGNRKFNGVFNIYIFGIILYAIFSPINLVFSRLARYYEVFQILLIPLAYVQATRFYKVVVVSVIIAFSILKFSTTINGDEGVFTPYQTIFSE